MKKFVFGVLSMVFAQQTAFAGEKLLARCVSEESTKGQLVRAATQTINGKSMSASELRTTVDIYSLDKENVLLKFSFVNAGGAKSEMILTAPIKTLKADKKGAVLASNIRGYNFDQTNYPYLVEMNLGDQNDASLDLIVWQNRKSLDSGDSITHVMSGMTCTK